MSDDPEPTGRGTANRWQAGQSGNPRGRPPGRRDHRLAALDALGVGSATGIVESVIKCALAGDMAAASLLLRRVWPERKGRPHLLEIPAIESPADLVVASATIIAMMSDGMISGEEAAIATGVLSQHRAIIETTELADRISALEAASGR